MTWLHDTFRETVSKQGLTQDALAERIGVSRQTVSSWFSGQVPKGLHLMRIWKLLGLPPGSLFRDDAPVVRITRPLFHTTDGQRTDAQQAEGERLVAHYKSLFPLRDAGPLQEAILPERTAAFAKALAMVLRERMAVADGRSPSLADVLSLLGSLGFCIIPVAFPDGIGADAFYVSVNYNRVLFVNRLARKEALARALVHEAVHAMRPDVAREASSEEVEAEERYCEDVVRLVFPADATPDDRTLDDVMFSMGETCQYVDCLRQHFKNWYGVVMANLDSLSMSRLAEILDLSRTDAEAFARCVREGDGL